MPRPLRTAYKRADICAAEKMLSLHFAKLKKAVFQEKWPDCCSALRAIQEEAEHASRVATGLSVDTYLRARSSKNPTSKGSRFPRADLRSGDQ